MHDAQKRFGCLLMSLGPFLTLHSRVYLAALVIFAAGALCGALVYLLNDADSGGDNFQIIGGQVFQTDASNSKAYDSQLERIGGRSAVFADQFNTWLGSLWHGQRMGITLMVLAALTSLILLWVARQMELEHLYRTTVKTE